MQAKDILITIIIAMVFGLGGGIAAYTILPLTASTQSAADTSSHTSATTPKVAVTENLSDRETAIKNIAKNASASVVSIVGTGNITDFWGQPLGSQDVVSGTGFVIDANGIIVTNKHVVSQTNLVYFVIMPDGTRIEVQKIDKDPLDDIAFAHINKTGLVSLSLANSDEIEIGQTAIAIGNTLGEFSNTLSVGVVSGLSRDIIARSSAYFGDSEQLNELVQTDAAINKGNSGGPLLNLKGEVIGMNTAIAEDAQSVGFAIPINRIKNDLASLESSGKIVHAYLGVYYLAINSDIQKQLNLSVNYGALIKSNQNSGTPAVVSGSPADKAGLKDGDIILSIDGVKLSGATSLSDIIIKKSVGDKVMLTVLRSGKTMDITITLEATPAN